jgi:hypothetical protein
MIPSPSGPRSCADTQRSIAHDFERWSTPPPIGADPIVPCDEPEDEDVVQWLPRPPVTSPQPVWVASPVDDPVVLPMERRFFWLMSVAILIAVASAIAVRLAL